MLVSNAAYAAMGRNGAEVKDKCPLAEAWGAPSWKKYWAEPGCNPGHLHMHEKRKLTLLNIASKPCVAQAQRTT